MIQLTAVEHVSGIPAQMSGLVDRPRRLITKTSEECTASPLMLTIDSMDDLQGTAQCSIQTKMETCGADCQYITV